jgi:hypothetical protein
MINPALEIILLLYVFFGSYATGYIYLRTGWPKIRTLEESYKIGWAIIIGVVNAIASIGIALLIQQLVSITLFSALLIAVAMLFTFATLLLTLRRKFIANKGVILRLPKEYVSTEFAKAELHEKVFK